MKLIIDWNSEGSRWRPHESRMTVLSFTFHSSFTRGRDSARSVNATITKHELPGDAHGHEPARSETETFPCPPAPPAWTLYLLVSALGAAMFAIALSGYPNLMDNERRVGNYVLDAVQNGHWIVQHDVTGAVASKPPLLMWIAGLATLAFGEINRFALYLPSALATVGVALLLLAAGKRQFGWPSGLLGAVIYLLSAAGARQMVTARYDGLLALPVTLAALAAFRAWSLGRGWTWFWLAGALGTLAKGAIALVLGAGGLLAHFWERRTGHETRLRGSHWPGVLLFLGICGGWFALAYMEAGSPVIQKMLGRELAAHATGTGRHETVLLGFYEPPWSFLKEFAPWSLVAVVAWWRVWNDPARASATRRFERFLFCWFFSGLALFCVAAHQRGRLIFPLIPAAALLAGRELARWVQLWSTRRLIGAASGLGVLVLASLMLYHHVLLGRSGRVQTTLGMREVAAVVRERWGERFPLVHVDTPFALQFYLNTAWPLASFERAAQLLKQDYPAYVCVSDYDKLLAQLGPETPALHEITRWPAQGPPVARIVGNRPPGDKSSRIATLYGPLLVRLDRLEFVKTRGHELVVRRGDGAGEISVLNQSPLDQPVRLRVVSRASGRADAVVERVLAPAETWRMPLEDAGKR